MRGITRGTPGTGRVRLAALGAATALVAACDSGQVPTDARLSVSPEERTIRITEVRGADGLCRTDGSRFVDVPMLLALNGPNGSPIEGAEVSVYVDFAGNTYSGRPVLALYEDRNGNGVVDADTELASAATDSIARVRTGSDGTHRLLLRADIACPYRGEVFAYAGAATARSSFEVEAAETLEPEAEEPRPPAPETPAPRLPDGPDEGGDVPAPADDATPDVGNPFETVPLEGEPDVDLTDEGEPAGDGSVDGEPVEDGPTGGAADDASTTPEADPQPLRCTAAGGRRTAVVCTVDAPTAPEAEPASGAATGGRS